jgi:hypothetical protein
MPSEEKCNQINRRIDRHEWMLEQHEEDISEVKKISQQLKDDTQSIVLALTQIKFLIIGGAIVYAIQATGFAAVVGALFGL